LAAVARDQFGDIIPGATPVWSSSDTEIAAVDAAGLLRTFATGTVVVTAKVDGRSGTQSFSITPLLVRVTFGAKEVVFDYTTDRCDNLDLPDQPARFVRSEEGSLVLVDGNAPRHYLTRGADFGSLKRDCSQPALISADRATPESYANWEWLWAVYREGPRWHALIHNEFHDAVASTCHPGDSSPSNPCWYNSITYAVSTDGARSFSKPSAPGNVIAPAPYAWVPPAQQASYFYAEGYMGPTNIVHANDGYYYSLFSVWRILQLTAAEGGICVMRTDALEDPARWRAWDGSSFNLRMTSPYVTGSPAPVCRFLKTPMASGHLVYSTYLNRYVQVAQAQKWINGRNVCGIFFALSVDLVHWSDLQLLAEAMAFGNCEVTPGGPGVLDTVMVGYSSIVDHADASANFERAGRTPYLYYTRFNDGGLDRDLVRVPLTFDRLD
jgi:hypothetical protein